MMPSMPSKKVTHSKPANVIKAGGSVRMPTQPAIPKAKSLVVGSKTCSTCPGSKRK